MSKTVLLVNPNRMRPPVAPIGLEYVAEALEERGYGVALCDLTFATSWKHSLEEAVAAARPSAVGVSIRNLDDAYFASQDFILEKTAAMLRHLRDCTEVPIILGGIGFTMAPTEVLAYTGMDYGIAGDGEEALPDLLDCLAADGDPARVAGAVFRLPNGAVQANAPAFAELDGRPAPKRAHFDNTRYFAEGGQAGIETKRGCDNRCIYCVEPAAKGRRVRLRAPQRVVEEMRGLLDRGIDVFHLCDSEFNRPQAHAMAVCEAIIQGGLAGVIRWYTYAYPQSFTPALARAMKQAGCAGINFGADHADARILKGLGHRHGPESIAETVRNCHAAGLTVMFDMLLGGPGETRETLATAIDFMREVEADRVGLSCGVRVYPHTLLADLVRAQGPLAANPHLHGTTKGNDNLLRPVFYVDAGLDGDVHSIVSTLVGGDKRFLHTDPKEVGGNYNYNDNTVLCETIKRGARGAYWDILRRIEVGELA